MRSISLAVVALSMPVLCMFGESVQASDWPQWRGPNRDGVSLETGLLKTWPKDGPKLIWTFEATGTGYSSFSVVGNTLYTLGAVDEANGDKEFVLAIDTSAGKERWRQQIGTYYKNGWGGGPRSTPTIDGDQLYALGANGDLACLSCADGKKIWSKSLVKDFKGGLPGWGYSESPLIDGDRLICTPGGQSGAMVALDKKSGAVIWRSTDFTDGAQYVSIIVCEVGGIRQYVTATSGGVYGIRAKDGKKLWSEKVAVNGTATIPTPIFYKNHVFMSSGYSAGCALIKLTPNADGIKAAKVYANNSITNHHGGVIRVGDYIYGHTDTGPDAGKWVCLEFMKTGSEDGPEPVSNFRFDKGSAIYADGSLYLLGESNGEVAKVTPTTDKWKEDGRLTIPKTDKTRSSSGGVWSHPVVANGKLFLRDQNYLFCYDIKGN